MRPPADGDPGSEHTPTDELLARIIPLRHRGPQTPTPPEDQPPATDGEEPPPRGRSIWDPAACEPVLRRRTAPATAAPAGASTPSGERSRRPRARDAVLAGTAAIIATVLVLSLTGPLSQSGGAPRQANALETHTAKPPSTRTHHRARPHPSPKHTTARARHATVHATEPRPAIISEPVSSAPAASAPRASAPAQSAAPARPGGAELELTFERPPGGRS